MPSASVVLVTAGYDHNIRFWEAPSGICYRTVPYPDSQVNKLAISPDKKYVAAAGNPHVRIFDINSSSTTPLLNFDGHTNNVTSVGFHKNCQWMYTGSEDGTVKVWDLRTHTCERDYESKGAVNTVALHPNQAELISGDQNGVIHVWDLTADSCTKMMKPQGKTPLRSISAGSDGSIAVAANNLGNCFVWPLKSTPITEKATDFTYTHTFQAHNSHILKCVLSPDTRTLATASSDKTVKLWRVSDFSLEKTLTAHQRWVWDCVFSEDSAYMVTASSDNTARLWDLSEGSTIRVYNGHTKAITTVALNDAP